MTVRRDGRRGTDVCYQPSGCDDEFRNFGQGMERPVQGMERPVATVQFRSIFSFARLIRNDFPSREL